MVIGFCRDEHIYNSLAVKSRANIDKWGSKKPCDDKDLSYHFIKSYPSNRHETFRSGSWESTRLWKNSRETWTKHFLRWFGVIKHSNVNFKRHTLEQCGRLRLVSITLYIRASFPLFRLTLRILLLKTEITITNCVKLRTSVSFITLRCFKDTTHDGILCQCKVFLRRLYNITVSGTEDL